LNRFPLLRPIIFQKGSSAAEFLEKAEHKIPLITTAVKATDNGKISDSSSPRTNCPIFLLKSRDEGSFSSCFGDEKIEKLYLFVTFG